ncbi:MAG: alpha/beta hydrolase [Pseudolabrys sp.]|jgi:pimeloyl-ACP methyl ester carboxylesterase
MATILVCHGAWSAGWVWKKMRPLMRARGHDLFTPTYTGVGERAHLASPDIDLETHIADILGVLEMEDLTGVNLIGHSYGGMVATGVADRARNRIGKLIYLDAFAPQDGDSLMDLVSDEVRAQRQARTPDGWRIPPTQMPADTDPEDVEWCKPRRMPQPAKTFEQKLKLQNGPLTLPRHYIYCTRITPGDRFRPFLERARREGWGVDEIDASHNPHVTCPDVLMGLLDRIAV